PPFHEVLVPVDQVLDTTPNLISLKCTRNDLSRMEPFECEEYIRTEIPEYLAWPYVLPMGLYPEEMIEYIPVKRQNLPRDGFALRRGAQVEATDGPVGQVDELLISSNTMQVTHLVLLERHVFKHREITIPVSQIDRLDEDTIYLRLDKQSVEQLPTTPVQRWPLNVKDSSFKRRNKMDKMLVVVFDSELKAYDGSRALQELQNEGSINLYAKAVIVRDAGGKVEIKQAGDMGPIGTAVGLLTGSLIGMIGGPVGLAVGAYAGTMGGMVYDLGNAGVSEDFLNEVGQSLKPGKAALVADVWEEWVLPADTRMEALGGVVFRRLRRDLLDLQVESDITTLKAEIDELESEHDLASGDARGKLQAKIDTARAKLQTTVNGIQARLGASQQETKAKIDSLQEQAAKARGERKAKLEKQIAELKAKQKRRSDQLEQAGRLTKEALSA
ncbi:MAG TPA: DUF1269 domain-containing protein, partial [Anaerolineales bacterium]